jgi:hypothetical protein
MQILFIPVTLVVVAVPEGICIFIYGFLAPIMMSPCQPQDYPLLSH